MSDTMTKNIEQRGIPPHSYFVIDLKDGRTLREQKYPWSTMCREERVKYFGETKTVFLCTLPVQKIDMFHAGLELRLRIPDGADVYQAIRSETILLNGRRVSRILGRTVGIVEDKEVVEEYFLNESTGVVQGLKK